MRVRRRFHLLAALLVALTATLSGQWVGYGQEQPQDLLAEGGGFVVELPTTPIEEPVSELRQGQRRVYLPLILSPLRLTAVTSVGANETTGEPINPTDTFNFGTRRIYFAALFEGATQRRYRFEATFPNGNVLRSAETTVPAASFRDFIFICRTTAFRCGSGEVELERGQYIFRIFIDNILYAERRAVVR